MRSASLIAIVLAVSFLFAQADLKAATEGGMKFDGNWSVTVDHKLYENPDGSKALPFVWHFPATVKHGVFHGEIGTRGKPGWYELNGQIEASGTAAFRADEISGSQKYNFTVSKKAPPNRGYRYSYQVVASFDSRRGTGHATDWRTRIFTFVKE